jgi:hypothetical protein
MPRDLGACAMHEDRDLRPASHILRAAERRAGLDGSDGHPPVVECSPVCSDCYVKYGLPYDDRGMWALLGVPQ